MFVCSQSRIREHFIVNIDKRSSIRIHVLTRIAKYLKDNIINSMVSILLSISIILIV